MATNGYEWLTGTGNTITTTGTTGAYDLKWDEYPSQPFNSKPMPKPKEKTLQDIVNEEVNKLKGMF